MSNYRNHNGNDYRGRERGQDRERGYDRSDYREQERSWDRGQKGAWDREQGWDREGTYERQGQQRRYNREQGLDRGRERSWDDERAHGRQSHSSYDYDRGERDRTYERQGRSSNNYERADRRFDNDRRQETGRIYGSSQTALRGGNYDRPIHGSSAGDRRVSESTVQPPRKRSEGSYQADHSVDPRAPRTGVNGREQYGNRPSVDRDAASRNAAGRDGAVRDPKRSNAAGRDANRSNAVGRDAADRFAAGRETAFGNAARRDGAGRDAANRSNAVGRDAADRIAANRETAFGNAARREGAGRDANRDSFRDDAAGRASFRGDAANRGASTPDTGAPESTRTATAAQTASEIAGKASSALASFKKEAAKALEQTGSLGDAVAGWANSANENARNRAVQEKADLEREAKSAAASGTDSLQLGEQKLQELAFWRSKASKAFIGILTVGLVVGLLFFLRPSVSQAENRELTKFPSFSITDFIDGAWTEGISTWYADTYPFRDQLMAVNKAMKGLYGFESSTQMYGTAAQSDEIPDEAKKQTVKKDPVSPETYDSWNLEADIQGQIMEGLYVDNGTVYATYGFTQEAADDYIAAVNDAAEKLDGTTQVYSILIPNNSGVLLSKDELAALGGSNQGQAIQYYYDSYDDKVRSIPTMKPLVDHKDEYIYFRTDHHWTSLAAYYVYQTFCEAKGIKSNDIATFEEKDFSPFLGSYYSQLQLDSLAADPDTVQAWIPKGTNDMKFTDVDGSTIDWNVIKDVSEWDQGTQYNCFVGGDQPWAEIHNPNITDGSSCLVVKESYGNAFVPWLVDHYQDVYIVDFRYNNDNVVDICKEKEVDDLILLNNISIIGSVEVAGKIASIL